jgi:hypothetical protein
LLTEEREIEGLKRPKKKKKNNDVVYLFFWVNWFYFIMGLLYWGLILEVLSFYGKKFWALFKKKNYALLNFFWDLILEALSFYGKKFWALFKKKKN